MELKRKYMKVVYQSETWVLMNQFRDGKMSKQDGEEERKKDETQRDK